MIVEEKQCDNFRKPFTKCTFRVFLAWGNFLQTRDKCYILLEKQKLSFSLWYELLDVYFPYN